MPAHPAGLRGRAADAGRAGADRHFAEASSAVIGGPYDVSLVEGSVTTPPDERRIREIREQSGVLVAIGACATAGGIQALRNFADVAEFTSVVYARPDYIHTLATSTPASAHVTVDYELRGCPIDRRQLLDTLAALLVGRKPRLPDRHGVHRMQAGRGDLRDGGRGASPCLGPVTHAGCGALCPAPSPRLLRLLRPDGYAEHAGTDPAAAPRRHVRPRGRTGCSRRSTSPSSSAERNGHHD